MKQELMKEETQPEVAEFEISELLGIGITLVVLVIAIAYGLQVVGDVRTDMTADSAEYNATTNGITAISKIPAKLTTVVTIIMAAVVIGILIRYLYVRFTGA